MRIPLKLLAKQKPRGQNPKIKKSLLMWIKGRVKHGVPILIGEH